MDSFHLAIRLGLGLLVFYSQGAWSIEPCPNALPLDSLERPLCKREWVFLLYMGADNDLAPVATQNLASIQEALQKSPDPQADWIYGIDQGNTPSIVRGGVEASGLKEIAIAPKLTTQENLHDFLFWAENKFPAKHYVVILWGHGTSWNGNFQLLYSQTNGQWLMLSELDGALKLLQKPEIVAMDLCLLQSAETAYALQDRATYIVGSLSSMPRPGLDYFSLVKDLSAGVFSGENGTQKLAQAFPLYAKGSIASAIKLDKAAITIFKADLANIAKLGMEWLAKDGRRSFRFLHALEASTHFDTNLVDASQFLSLWNYFLGKEIDTISLQSAILNAQTTLQSMEITKNSDTDSGALSLWIPRDSIEFSRERTMLASALYQDTPWEKFLGHIYQQALLYGYW